MKIIIAGAGRIGGSVAEVLSKEGHDLAVIDISADTIEHLSNEIDVIGVVGSVTDPDVLMEAGADKADLLLAVTEQDEVNMVCAVAAKNLGTAAVAARVRDPGYLGKESFLEKAFGISVIVNPEFESALEIARILRFPSAARVDTFSRGKAEIVEHKVAEDSKLAGVALKDIPRLFGAKTLITLAERGKNVFIPNGDFIIESGDKLSLMGDREELRRFFMTIGAYKKPVRSVIITGGSRTSVYLTRLLLDSHIEVTIVDKDRERCDRVYDLVPKAKVICGDVTKSGVLLEEGINNTDAFVALTGDDGDNVITSIYASHLNVGKVVTKVEHEHFAEVLGSTDLDCFIIPKAIVVGQLTRYVRAISNSSGSIMESLHKLADGRAEALEFEITEDSGFTGIPLKDLSIKNQILIACLIRGNQTILPSGSTVIEAGDHAVIISAAGRIRELKDILE